MDVDIFRKLLFEIESKKLSKAFILGINGVDTSGKSIFAKEFEKYLRLSGKKVQLIHIDDFHNESIIRYQGENEIDSYIENAFNLNLLEKEILLPIQNKILIDKDLLLLDLDSDKYTQMKNYYIDNETIVIIEGVLLYREPIEKYFDFKVFLDISFETVLKRAEIRDVPKYGVGFLEKYSRKYIPIQQIYLSQYSPKEKSNCIIDNNDYYRPKIIKMSFEY